MLKTNRELAYFLYRYSERQHFGAFSFFFYRGHHYIQLQRSWNVFYHYSHPPAARSGMSSKFDCEWTTCNSEHWEQHLEVITGRASDLHFLFIFIEGGSLEISKDFMKEICLTIEIWCVLWPSAVRLFALLRLQLSRQNCNDSWTFISEDLLCPMFHRKTGSTPRSGQKRSVHWQAEQTKNQSDVETSKIWWRCGNHTLPCWIQNREKRME